MSLRVTRRSIASIKSEKLEGEPRRLLRGIHDVEAFVRDIAWPDKYWLGDPVQILTNPPPYEPLLRGLGVACALPRPRREDAPDHVFDFVSFHTVTED